MLVVIAQLMTLVFGLFGWIAVMFASLPGSSLSMSWHARCIRGVFYTYPAVVLLALYLLRTYGPDSVWAFAAVLIPLLPVVLVWLIFKLYEWIERRSA